MSDKMTLNKLTFLITVRKNHLFHSQSRLGYLYPTIL
jgi:hypothetical protein